MSVSMSALLPNMWLACLYHLYLILIIITTRQNTFRPVFAPLLRLARPERKRVTQLRRLLADAGLLYDHLKQAWQEQKVAGEAEAFYSINIKFLTFL